MKQTGILYGKPVAEKIHRRLKKYVDELTAKGHRPPGLGIINPGSNPASEIYVKNKMQSAASLGYHVALEKPTTERDLLKNIEQFNKDENIDGFIVQLPLPPGWNTGKILEAVNPSKDADGFHIANLGKIATGYAGLFPATPQGIVHLLNHYGISVRGKHVVIAGRSRIVGRPLEMMLGGPYAFGNATVTLVHSQTKNTIEITRQADIFISAIGKANYWKKENFKPGVVIIDVGINRLENGSIVGDVHFKDVVNYAEAVTPVPGGIGPLTVASLLENVWKLYEIRNTSRISG